MNQSNLHLNEQLNRSWFYGRKEKLLWVIGLLSIFLLGLKYISHHNKYKDLEATNKFQVLLFAISINDNLTAKMHAKEILDYSDRTPYPRLSGILLATTLAKENDLIEANKVLNLVIARKKIPDEIGHLANLRLIKILLMQKDLTTAEKTINDGLKYKKFTSRYQELLGDLFLAKNKLLEAHESYKEAAMNLPAQVIAPWLDLKIKETNMDQNEVLKIET